MLFPDLWKKPAAFTPLHPPTVTVLSWATERDLAAIQAINAGLHDPWPRTELARLVVGHEHSTMAARRGDFAIGFASYRLRPKVLELVHFAVAPAYRKIGVGAQLFDVLDRKLGIHGLPRMTAAVSEDDPATYNWFRGRGMRGCGVECDGVRPGVDQFLFEYWAADLMAAGAQNCPESCP